MRIEIKYESSWRNSFLDGSNNEPLPKTGRKFIGSMTSLRDSVNYIPRNITHDTVMGVLNRLIGDQRKLYQSREQESYYFTQIEPLVTFDDRPSYINQEMTYIRNITGSEDKSSYAGMIKVDDPIFCLEYSKPFWGVLQLNVDELLDFILEGAKIQAEVERNPLTIVQRFAEIKGLKPLPKELKMQEAYDLLKNEFQDFKGLTSKGEVKPESLYCSTLYLQLARLEGEFDVSSAKTKSGVIKGVSKNDFTPKDFMSSYTTGGKKKIWGNPYIRKERIKGIGEVTSLMEKAGGTLNIEIAVNRETANDFYEKIQNAGVSSFYLGKKGLAYVSNIRI